MHVIEALTHLGGVADGGQLRRVVSKKRLRKAVRDGDIVRLGRRRYALLSAEAGPRAAMRLAGASSHLSAALSYGWQVKMPPVQPSVIVPRGRKVVSERRRGVQVRWRTLSRTELEARVTDRVRTVIDCARDLPFDEALAVADSALRSGDVTHDELIEAALALPTTGRARALRVVSHASGLSANPFESVLRAIAIEAGLQFEPQVVIDEGDFRCRPDLVDVSRRLVIEAESAQFHATRDALGRDCHRYTQLVIRGWRVVRFTWAEVMFDPDYVRRTLIALVQGPSRPATPADALPYPA